MDNFIKKIDFEIKKDSNTEYHSKKDYISASGLKKIKQSPLHFKEAESKESEAFAFGSAYHTFILEPKLFESEYYIFSDTNICEILVGEGYKNPRATKKYKEWYENQMRLANDKTILDEKDYKMLIDMRKRLTHHRYAKTLITNGEAEMSVYCEIEIFTGQKVKVKIRPDYLKTKKRFISDLKTTKSASIYDFPRSASSYDYHIQAALYSDIMNKINGNDLGYDFFFIAQEKVKPYAFNIFESSPQFLGQGRYEWEQLIMLYIWCIENDKWPGYQCFTQNKYGINELSLPPYLIREINWFEHK